jgi:diguanylate cyclase (GGDEF)-like protein
MAPRRLDFVTRASCEFFGRMLSWQLGSRLMAGDVQRKLWASGLIGAYTQALSLVSDFSEGLLSQPQQLLELFAAQGLALRIDSKFRRSGRAPDEALATSIATALRPAAVDGVAVSHHLAALLPEFSADAATASGALLIMLSEDGGDYLLCLRGEVISSIDWAGDIRVPLTEANGKLRPRTSFALWQETLRGQSVRWSTQDVDSARRLRKRVLERLEAVEHLRAQERLRHVAHHDALTQLPNRVGFQESLAQLLAEAQRDGSLLAVLFVDLDHFKSVNDTLGHAAGDRILRAAGERMRGCVRHADVVTRLGGDEFVVISPNLSKADDADVVAGKILEAIGERFAFDEGRDIRLTASVGVAVYPADARETETLLQCADDAMYRAKEAGRNRFARFTRGVETA